MLKFMAEDGLSKYSRTGGNIKLLMDFYTIINNRLRGIESLLDRLDRDLATLSLIPFTVENHNRYMEYLGIIEFQVELLKEKDQLLEIYFKLIPIRIKHEDFLRATTISGYLTIIATSSPSLK